ncbi:MULTISPECIES: hypothetical protein [unclassified Streptomyces]|uniref:hypothetical protein n=1 Tax=unclassified Streptomyces TaxID=2593676 RepID=UPI00341ADF02
MEQRIDSNIWPERAVGKDPAYVPGLMVPRPAGTAETDPEQAETEERAPEGGAPSDVLPEAVPDEPALDANGTTTDKTETAEEVSSDASSEEDAPTDDASAEDGPVFEVTDRRGAIIADSKGVRFRLDDQEADFWWSEIGAVEIKTPRFGRRFTVTVHVSERRWFDAEVEADTRNRLKEWTEELDAVLDAYFEES